MMRHQSEWSEDLAAEIVWISRMIQDGSFAGNTLLVWGASRRLRLLLELQEDVEFGQLYMFEPADIVENFDLLDKNERLALLTRWTMEEMNKSAKNTLTNYESKRKWGAK